MESKKKNGGKSDQGLSAPKQYIYRILCHGKLGQENLIYDVMWGALIPWALFNHLFFRLLAFLDFYAMTEKNCFDE
jgi:hypothetical protein